MSDDKNTPLTIDISAWVEKAKLDPIKYKVRQATEILLTAIGLARNLKYKLCLKGGVLMALAYHSPRMTGDVDFTWLEPPSNESGEQIREDLNVALKRATAELGYTKIICQVQTVKEQPRPWGKEEFNAPAISLTVGFAERGTSQEQALAEGHATQVISMDISFKEPVGACQQLILSSSGVGVNAYTIADLIAEKLRALLQQIRRKHTRARRQDVYDIALLVGNFDFDTDEKIDILKILLEKSLLRGFTPTKQSISDPELISMAKSEWHTMKLELEALPEFEESYDKVRVFYESLPWEGS